MWTDRSRAASAIPAQSRNIAFLVAIAFAIVASANLPVILYSLFWKRFNTRAATRGIYGPGITGLERRDRPFATTASQLSCDVLPINPAGHRTEPRPLRGG